MMATMSDYDTVRISPAPAPRQTMPGGAHPPRHRGLRIRQCEIAADFRRVWASIRG